MSCVLGCCALAMIAATCRPAAAQYFQYDTTLTLSNISPMESGLGGNGTDDVMLTTDMGTLIEFQALDSSVIFPDNLDSTGTGTDIVFGTIDVTTSNATPFENLSFDFDFKVDLSNYTTNSGGISDGLGTFHITGMLTGTIGAGLKLNLNTISVDPIPSQVIGGNTYSLVFQTQHFTPPGPIFPGAIGVHVTSVVPEPSTLTLMAAAALGLATTALRRRRKSRRLRI